MGPARLHNDLDEAVAELGGSARYFDHPEIIRKNLEAGCPSEYVKVVVFLGATATIARALLPPLKEAIIAWMKLRADREVELQVDGIKVRIKGRNDVDEAIRVLEELSEKRRQGRLKDRTSSNDNT